MGKKKGFSVASLDASKLKNVDKPVVKDGGITTSPKSGTVDVSRDGTLMVYFSEGVDPKSIGKNITVETVLGERAPVMVRVSALGDVALDLQAKLEPNTKYFFKFGNKLRNAKGKRITGIDNSIFFITGK